MPLIELKKSERPYCPICKTHMIPSDLKSTDEKTIRAWICNCNPEDHTLSVEL